MQFVFPTTFTINENTLIVEFLFSKKEYDFARIKSYYPDNTGVLLSPFISPSRLENFRGIYVRYGRENKEKIVGMIKERVKV
jgi:hypothetical protein